MLEHSFLASQNISVIELKGSLSMLDPGFRQSLSQKHVLFHYSVLKDSKQIFFFFFFREERGIDF